MSSDVQLEEYLLRVQSSEVEQVYPYLSGYLFQENPQTPLVLEALTHAYLFTNQFNRAGVCLDRWLKLQPDNVQALYLRGTYHTLKMKLESAIQDLRRALELDPQHLAARLLLAQVLRERHHNEQAAAEFQTVLQQEPNNFAARVGLASYYADMKEWTEARPLLQELYREKPDNAEVLHLQGRLAEADGRLDEAVRFLKASLDANPGDATTCYHLVLCYQRQGDEKSAGEWQDHLDRLEKDQARMLDLTNNQSEGLASDPALCCELGAICLRLGIARRGLYWLHAALHIDPHYRPAHEQLLHYYEKLGSKGEKDAAFHRQQLARKDTG